jgi:hypothetical protein
MKEDRQQRGPPDPAAALASPVGCVRLDQPADR